MTEAEQVTLLTMWDRAQRTTTVATEAEVVEHLQQLDPQASPAFAALEARGLAEPVEGGWQLTEAGVAVAPDTSSKRMQAEFDRVMHRYAESAANAELSRRVYGVDRFHFNMLDHEQVACMLAAARLSGDQCFVDVGCGVGSVTRHICDVTGAAGLGLDFAPRSIAWATDRFGDPRLDFAVGNLDALELAPRAWDAVLFIDTIYFAADKSQTLQAAAAALKPGGRLLIWFSCSHETHEPATKVDADQTAIAHALDALGMSWTAQDHREGAHGVWRRTVEAVGALQERFDSEGNADLCQGLRDESTRTLPVYEEGRARRWLYVATR